jgi:hypothetical protein
MPQFPTIFKAYASDPDTKAMLFLEVAPVHGEECHNCHGLGFMYAFLATKGPLKYPSGGKAVVKWDSSRRCWWEGQTVAGVCPVCKGASAHPVLKDDGDPEVAEINNLSSNLEVNTRYQRADRAEMLRSERAHALERAER